MTNDNDYVEQATTFDSTDAPTGDRLDGSESRRSYYKRLSLANTLDWNGKWRDEKRATNRDGNAILDAVASQLELTDFQKQRARRYYKQLPDSYNQAYSTRLVAFCCCGIAGKKDGRNYHPNYLRSDKSTRFASVAESFDIDADALYSLWERVRVSLE